MSDIQDLKIEATHPPRVLEVETFSNGCVMLSIFNTISKKEQVICLNKTEAAKLQRWLTEVEAHTK